MIRLRLPRLLVVEWTWTLVKGVNQRVQLFLHNLWNSKTYCLLSRSVYVTETQKSGSSRMVYTKCSVCDRKQTVSGYSSAQAREVSVGDKFTYRFNDNIYDGDYLYW